MCSFAKTHVNGTPFPTYFKNLALTSRVVPHLLNFCVNDVTHSRKKTNKQLILKHFSKLA